jgi:hypothetical protein
LFAQPSSAAAGTPIVRVGAVSLAIPSPSPDLEETGPDYRVLLEPLSPISNRLVAAFVTLDELKALTTTAETRFSTYALVETLRRAEFATITPAMFTQALSMMDQQFGTALNNSLKDSEDQINRTNKVLSSNPTTITLEKPVQLGTFFSKADAAGYGALIPVTANGVTKNMAMGIVVTRLQNRLIFGYLFCEYKDDTTVAWLRSGTEHWADALLAANQTTQTK